MNVDDDPPLAELHLHLYGCLRSSDILAQLLDRGERLDLAGYERAYHSAYATPTSVRDILARVRTGDATAAEAFEALYVFGETDAGNFARFQAKFDLILASSHLTELRARRAVGHAPFHAPVVDEIERFTAAVWRDLEKQGIGYAEARFFLSRDPHSEDWVPTLDAMERGVARARSETGRGHGPTLRIAASLPRANPWPQWEALRAIALGPHRELLTGLDFCFVEEGHPPAEKREFFAAVREHNARHPDSALAILYHVGESFTDKSLESAVRWVHEAAEFGAHRLGHAIALGVDPDALGPHTRSESVRERRDQLRYDLAHAEGLERFGVRVDRVETARELSALETRAHDEALTHAYDAARLHTVRCRQDYAMDAIRRIGAVIEVCPTSNRRIGGIRDAAHHPVHRFLAAKLPVVVSSDDPGIFGTTLADELAWVAREARLSADEMRAIRVQTWRARSEVLSGRTQA